MPTSSDRESTGAGRPRSFAARFLVATTAVNAIWLAVYALMMALAGPMPGVTEAIGTPFSFIYLPALFIAASVSPTDLPIVQFVLCAFVENALIVLIILTLLEGRTRLVRRRGAMPDERPARPANGSEAGQPGEG